MYRHHQSEPGYYRGWLKIPLPLNPICWLIGHSPKVVIKEWRYAIDPSLWIDCALCGRRYRDSDRNEMVRSLGLDREGLKQLERDRVANARRLPASEFLADVNRRDGWVVADLELHHEAHWPSRKEGAKRRSWTGFSVKLHLGNASSETPIDGHLTAGPFGYYWSVGGVGGRLAELVGRGHKRDLALSVDRNMIRWQLWYDDDGGNDSYHRCDAWRQPTVWPWSKGRRKHRGWMCLRNGWIDTNPLDALWGTPKATRTVIADQLGAVPVAQFPGDTYLMRFRLERVVWAREHGPAFARRPTVTLAVDVDHRDADGEKLCNGIPTRNGSWKGDETLSVHFAITENPGDDWLGWAAAKIVETTVRDRARYGYRPPTDVVR